MATRTASSASYTALKLSAEDLIRDYRLAYTSRQASLLGRREVLTGKAKFGIFGDGKELAQLAAARSAQPGDIRSGYYRDQTFLFAVGQSSVQKFFAQLYAHTSTEHEPASGGRQMNGHFATRWLDAEGNWLNLTQAVHSSADSSPTASQMPRMLGLAHASKLYRNLESLQTEAFQRFSHEGNEIVWGSIGDASTSEGLFWETMNAAGVTQVPLLMSVWDDNYGISVPIAYQTTKGSISEALKGLNPTRDLPGVKIYTVKGWDWEALVKTYADASKYVRKNHAPALVHVQEVTQPQGHSTSGSHERYKTKERLAWETEFDCVTQFRQYLLDQEVATAEQLDEWEKEDKKQVSADKRAAWDAFHGEVQSTIDLTTETLRQVAEQLTGDAQATVAAEADALAKIKEPIRKDALVALRKGIVAARGADAPIRQPLLDLKAQLIQEIQPLFSSHLLAEGEHSALNVPHVPIAYGSNGAEIAGFELLQQAFTAYFEANPHLVAFGEDLGFLGDVNQGMAGLQEKFGVERVFDTGIREATIAGQGIGMAMRGLRPIAEMQYLDYLLYAIQILSDDAATLRWRTANGQQCPVIIRTRGHRLEGVWHSGSPMQMILGSLRGFHVCVPRNMTQAAGMYHTLLQAQDPGLVIEVLNGYRLKEPKPTNIGAYTVPLGHPDVLRTGEHLTLVTYGACVRIAEEACDVLAELGISVELIDVQTLLPFDLPGTIGQSLAKTNRLVVLDEDVPGGGSAYILQQVLEQQRGYFQLDSAPVTLHSQPHRPAYATDGDYFSKPSAETVIEACYGLLHEFDPVGYPGLF